MAPPVLLVVGPPSVGKTSLLQRFLQGECDANPKPSIGMETGMAWHLDQEDAIFADLRDLLPASGIDFELMEIGGREPVHREMPRGRYVCGLMLCYDCRDRTSFLRLWHVLCRHRMDRHMEISSSSVAAKGNLAAVLCATKSDQGPSLVSEEEVKTFASANHLEVAMKTSAHNGQGVTRAFQTLALRALEAEMERRCHIDGDPIFSSPQRAFALPCGLDVCPELTGLTNPPNLRPAEPQRGIPATEHFVEVLDGRDGQVLCDPRTMEQCLTQSLLHRAVHVWLCVPRSGALLLRKWQKKRLKHPGLWGPTCHTEIRCYGEGDGHASEVSTQSAERALQEQLGLPLSQVGDLIHCFSCQMGEGNCQELLDVYLAPLSKAGLPPLALAEDEEVDWVFFAHVMSPDFARAGRLFYYNNIYRRALARRMRDHAVREDVHHAFALDLDAELSSKSLAAAMRCPAPEVMPPQQPVTVP